VGKDDGQEIYQSCRCQRAKIVTHSCYVTFQMAEVAIPRELFAAILTRIRRLRPPKSATG
jgi:hypothetical protein